MLDIKITRAETLKEKPEDSKLGFGKYFTDHMFLMDYTEGRGWHDARIVPYAPITLEPSAMVFHYAQELFEGLKAYRTESGKIQLFRPDRNVARMNNTCERLCVPKLDPDDVLTAIKSLVAYEADWVPHSAGTSLYIRPFIIATDAALGVHPSHSYLFIIILSPVGTYYAAGLDPVKIYIEKEYVRAVRGGTGQAKCGGNYAASLIAQSKAEEYGCEQALWTDGVEHKYIDEVGSMNVFFVIDGEVVTPDLSDGNILPGVTRASSIELMRSWGLKVTERKVTAEELFEAHAAGRLDEAFGTGTAAVVSPIGELNDSGKSIIINDGKIGAISQRLYDELTGIQWGKIPDKFGWTVEVQ
ncbi:MAG: branched-chain amino acid aminotransferase [Firmicutes bacterium]|nr:branched-chain amino acid aminotransferase [Bacillota bacterium]